MAEYPRQVRVCLRLGEGVTPASLVRRLMFPLKRALEERRCLRYFSYAPEPGGGIALMLKPADGVSLARLRRTAERCVGKMRLPPAVRVAGIERFTIRTVTQMGGPYAVAAREEYDDMSSSTCLRYFTGPSLRGKARGELAFALACTDAALDVLCRDAREKVRFIRRWIRFLTAAEPAASVGRIREWTGGISDALGARVGRGTGALSRRLARGRWWEPLLDRYAAEARHLASSVKRNRARLGEKDPYWLHSMRCWVHGHWRRLFLSIVAEVAGLTLLAGLTEERSHG